MMNAQNNTLSSSSSDDDLSADEIEYKQMNEDLSEPGEMEKINVLVTGFGPFAGHDVNASWEAVKELRKLGSVHSVNLITQEIPVEYQTVKQVIPELWKKHKPKLVVHVGVTSYSNEVTIETCAHNDGYDRLDVAGSCAPSECYIKNGIQCLHTGLDVDRLCADINESSCLAMAVSSVDAGRYLCEYIYYASLCEDSTRVIFIHVPPLDTPYSSIELGHALQMAILSMLKQLNLFTPLPAPDSGMLEQLRREQTATIDAALNSS